MHRSRFLGLGPAQTISAPSPSGRTSPSLSLSLALALAVLLPLPAVSQAGIPCVDGNTFDGDCCSAAGIQEESRFGFINAGPGLVNSRAVECLHLGLNVCEDGLDNDGDGLIDSEDPECTTLSTLQRQAVVAYDVAARNGLKLGGQVRIRHATAAGERPDHADFFIAGVCDAGACACPDTLIGAEPEDPNDPPLARPACEIQGYPCSTDADCEPLPYPRAQSHAEICGYNMFLRRDNTIEGNVIARGNVRFGRGYLDSENLSDVGTGFYCDGCVERLGVSTPQPNVRFDAQVPWVGPGVCLPSATKSCFSSLDCCELDRVTCYPPALPGDVCRARMRFDFLPDIDPEHNPNVVLTGGTLDPNDPASAANAFDRCVAALDELERLAHDSGLPGNLGVADLPGIALTAAPAIHTENRIFIRGEQSLRLSFPGGGTHVRDIDMVNMRRAATLELEAPADATLVLRVLRNLRVGGENSIALVPPDPNNPSDVVSPDNVIWILDDRRGSAVIRRHVDFPGTIVAPSRRVVKVGGSATVRGAVMGRQVDLLVLNELLHQPFIPLLPTHLTIEKTGVPDPQNPDAPAGVVVAGEDILYTIDVQNLGPSYAPGAVVTDVLPPEVTFNSATITQGNGSCEYVAAAHTVLCYLGTLAREDDPDTAVIDNAATIEISVTTLADTRGNVTNTFEVNANVEQSVPGANSGSIDTLVIGISDLNVIAKVDAPDPAVAGLASGLTYTITVENLGPSDAFEADPPGVQLTDVIPPNLTIVSATHQPGDGGAPQPCNVTGQTVTCDMGRINVIHHQPNGTEPNPEVVTIVVTPACNAHLTHPPLSPLGNSASVSNTGELDPDLSNNTASTTTGFIGEVDLSSTKTASIGLPPAFVVAGESMTYTLTVQNDGPSDATNVVISDTLPAGLAFAGGTGCSATGGTPFVDQEVTCTLPTIGCNASAGRTFSVNVASNVAEGTVVTNNVTALAQDETEINPGNETSSRDTLVRRRADLAIVKTRTNPVGTCIPGEDVSYDVVVSNNGPSDATGAIVTDTFPASLSNCSWTCAASGNASCAAAGAGNINEAVNIAAGAGNSVTFSITCDINPNARGTLSNAAAVAKEPGTIDDPVVGNNSNGDDCTLTPIADLTLSKSDAGFDPAVAGTPSGIVYVLTIDNDGPSDAIDGDVILTDTLPAGVAFVSAVHSGGGACNEALGVVTCNLGTIDVADPAETVTITVTPSCDLRGIITNQAQVVTGGEADPGSPNAVTEDTTIVDDVTLAITKQGDPASIEEDVDLLTYEIEVTNNAAFSCALNTTVTDILDPALQGVTISSSQGGCSALPCNLGTVNAGASAMVTITAIAADGTAMQNDTTFDEITNVASVDSDEPEAPQTSAPPVVTDVTLNLGDACVLGTDCASGNCVDGVCCDVAACGTCEACNLAGSEGSCAAVLNGPDEDTCSDTVTANCALTACTCDAVGQCVGALGASDCTDDADCVAGYCSTQEVCCDAPQAGDIFVAADGSGDYATVQEAITAAAPGETVVVECGTYNEDIQFSQKQGLTLLGARTGVPAGVGGVRDANSTAGESTIVGTVAFDGGAPTTTSLLIDGFRWQINNNGNVAVRVLDSYTLQNVVIDAPLMPSNRYVFISVGFAGATPHSLALTDSTVVTTGRVFSIENGLVSSALISNNVFEQVAASLVSASALDGVVTLTDNHITGPRGVNLLTNHNTVTGNTFNVATGGSNRAFDLYETTGNVITDNTFLGDALAILVVAGGRGEAVLNNTISDNSFLTTNAVTNSIAGKSVNVDCNWYGSAVFADVAAKISGPGPVVFEPFLSSPTGPCDGFGP